MPQMNYDQLKKEIASEKLYNLYLLQGEEYIVEYFEKSLHDKILGDNYSDFDMSVFNEENLNLDNLVVALETFPVKALKKCIIIRNLPIESWDTDQTENFMKIISDIPEFSNLIISQYLDISGAKNIAKFKKIQKAVSESGIISNFSKKDIPVEKQLIFWAKKEYGKNLSPENAKTIINICMNHSLTALKNELKKICELESTDTITESSLKVASESKYKTNIFDLPKAILAKDLKKAFKLLGNLLEQKEEPISILAVISNEYIDMYRVKVFMDDGENTKELTRIFDYKNKEFRLKNAEKRCDHIDIGDIKNCLEYLINADIKLKSTTLNPKLILSRLITNLMTLHSI